ncbi:hypothetical protein BASA62_004217 [Batrachochytrium salamandrivorans]|nr:hypothetical protein BASA62_004217 [Batrachochytrium salamandrivorans]
MSKAIIDEARSQKLKAISFDDTGLKDVPLELFELTGLLRVNLAHNKITELPEDIYLLKNLEIISVFSNRLVGLPKNHKPNVYATAINPEVYLK